MAVCSMPCSKSTAFILLTIQAVITLAVAYLTTSYSSPWTLLLPSKPGGDTISRVFERAENESGIVGVHRFPDLISLHGVTKYSAPKLPRAMAAADYVTLMRLLELTVKVLEAYDIEHVLAYGSLIGSYVMHDILPWDDDIDVFIHNASKAKLMEIFKNDSHYGIQGFHYPQSSGQIYKLYFNSSNRAGKYSWNWPFIDIVSYTQSGKNIVPVEKSARSRLSIPKSSFYPFHKRPFGPLWLNAPRDPTVVLRLKYKTFYCRSGFWNHQKETDRKALSAPCNTLNYYYPFVQRTQYENRTEETLILNERPLYKIVVDEAYQSSKSIYGW